MEFYTSVHPVGDKILVRGYQNGRAYQRKVDFYPTLFVTSKVESKWKTLEDTFVDEIKPGGIRETRDFLKRYEGVEGFPVYGNTNYAYQYISDTYEDDVNWGNRLKFTPLTLRLKLRMDSQISSLPTKKFF